MLQSVILLVVFLVIIKILIDVIELIITDIV